MKILVVDDEAPARARLQRMLAELPDYEMVAEAANGVDAIQLCNQLRPEIVLLDIRMPVMDGMEVARHLMSEETPPAIIFTTAYGDHALEAFETHAVDYLLKPIRNERLQQALTSAKRSTRAQLDAVQNHNPTDKDSRQRSHFCIRHRGNLLLVPVGDVYFLRAEDKYVSIFHKDGQALIEESLVGLEKEFADLFLRVHRNALVANHQVVGLDKRSDGASVVRLKNSEETVEVSRRHLSTVRKFLKQQP